MPRARRIEYENAIYHVMARGNRREPIVFNDRDRELLAFTLSEAATRCGWEVFAWVSMDNLEEASEFFGRNLSRSWTE